MLENILKKEKTTVNELQYEDKKQKENYKNDSMFLATWGKMSAYKSKTISGFKSEFDNPLYSMQEKYMSELNNNY